MLRSVSPAPLLAVLEVAPPFARVRGRLLAQAHACESAAIYHDDDGLLVVAFVRGADGTRELALGFTPAARRHMLPLARLCQSMLAAYGDNGITVMASILPENRQARRLASLVGFVADQDEPRTMVRNPS